MKSILNTLFNKTPVPYAPPSKRVTFNTPEGSTNPQASMRAMGSVGTLFAIVSRSASATSAVEWGLYKKRVRSSSKAAKGDRSEVDKHLALDVLKRPNDFYTLQELIETVQQHIDLTGEGFILISRNKTLGWPQELWPVRPDRMKPVTHATEFLLGWEYTGPDGTKITLDRRDVIHIKMPNPLDPYRGLGPVQAVMTDIQADKNAAEYNRNFFVNGAAPGGFIEFDDELTDDEFDRVRDRWAQQHQGVENAHRVAIIEKGSWVEAKYSMRDMQFTELRQVSREQIREAFGFPKPMLGAVDDVNRANAEAAEYVFAKWFLRPRLERFKQAFNNDLLPQFGTTAENLELDYHDPVQEDRVVANEELTSKVSAAKTLIDMGVEPAQAFEAVGLPEFDIVEKEVQQVNAEGN